MARVLVEELLKQLSYPYAGNTWYAALSDLIANTTTAQAAWRPQAGGHSIYELVCHLAYADRLTATRLSGGAMEWNEAEAWVTLPAPLTEAQWAQAVTALESSHMSLVSALGSLTDEHLPALREGRPTILDAVTPLIQHEAFHAGQIAYIRRLQGQAPLL